MSSIVRLTLLLCTAMLASALASATTIPDLYEISVPLDGVQGQDAAFVEALKAVAVRVSGQRDAANRLGSGVTNARQYAQRFGTVNRMLQVGFDSVAIDKLLSNAGLPIWGRERPATLVLLNIREADGSSRWADGQFGGPEREAVTRIARLRGLPLVWPTVDAQEQARIMQAGFNAAALVQIAQRFDANATLLGFAQRGSGNSLSVRWVLAADDGATELESVLEEGVHLAADTFARNYGASASAALGNVMVEISGITNLAAYAAAVNYLEGMTVVRGMAVEQMAGDTLRLRLSVRGDATTLRRAVTLDKRLVPQSNGALAVDNPRGQVASLQFRYQP